MSLKIKIAARLKVLFPGVALSKKTIEAIGEQLSKAGLTDESTDDEIDTKLNERNALYSFEDQKKFDDYQAGKAAKDAADKEAKRLADLAAGKSKRPDDPELPSDTPEWAKAFMKAQKDEADALRAEIASIKGEKVATTRREQYAKALEGTSDAFKAKALKDFDRMNFKDDADFAEYLADATEDAKTFIQDEANGGLGGDRPAGGDTGGKDNGKTKLASDTELDAVMENL